MANTVKIGVTTDGLFEVLKTKGYILKDCNGLGLYACSGIVLHYPTPSSYRKGMANIIIDSDLYTELEMDLLDFELPFSL